MDVIGAYEAKTHLPRLLDEVASGKALTITKHGIPVARLVPARPVRARPADTIAALRAARQGVRRGEVSVRDMIEEGRR